MKKYLVLFLLPAIVLITNTACEEGLVGDLSDSEIVAGLKEALQVGTDNSVSLTNVTDGYWANPVKDIRILLPDEFTQIESVATTLGLQGQIDNLRRRMNEAAENAADEAKPIFIDAITNITIADGTDILFGADNAATNFLQVNTQTGLHSAFKPDIQTALEAVGAQQSWETITTTYNPYASSVVGQIAGLDPINTDLADYTTDKALDGLFKIVEVEEKKIRDDPFARVTSLLERVFGQLD